MRMEIISSNSSTTSRARARITVPHAADRREAEETVASLVEWGETGGQLSPLPVRTRFVVALGAGTLATPDRSS